MKKVFNRAAFLAISLVVVMAVLFSGGAFATQAMRPIIFGKGLSPSLENAIEFIPVGGAESKAPFRVKSVSLKVNGSKIGVFMKPGEVCRFAVKIKYSGKMPKPRDFLKQLTVTSSEPDVVSVFYYTYNIKRGIHMRAEQPGSISIQINAGDKTDSVLVCVMDSYPAGVVINADELLITRGYQARLMATIYPNRKPQSFKWTSSDSSVASINKNGLVKAFSPGMTIITATRKGLSEHCAVWVFEDELPSSITRTPVSATKPMPIPYRSNYIYKR